MLDTAILVAATVDTGLLAGLFYAFTVSVMPGLRRVDDRTFVDAMQRINVAIINPWFFGSFLGAPLLTVVAAALQDGAVLAWILAALALYGVVLAITVGVNIPLNNALAAAGPPDRAADPTAVRARFEAPWVRWNVARAVVATAGFGCLAVALAL